MDARSGRVAPAIIYGLCDPRDGIIRYVGKTEIPRIRLRLHVWEAGRNESRKSLWIRGLVAAGVKVEFVTLATVPIDENWEVVEKKFIAEYRGMGFDLFNGTSGGQGVPDAARGPKWRAALAASHVGNAKRVAGALAAAEKNRGRKLSEEAREAIGRAHRGRKLSAEHVAKVVAFHKGRKRSPEIAAKCGLARLGKANTPESNEKRRQTMAAIRDKQSDRQRNNWADPEFRARVTKSMTGHVTAASVKTRLAETSKASWDNPEHRQKRTVALKAAMATPEWRESRRMIAKRLWSDPDFRARMMEARRKK